jgi:hypothetical protein
METLFFKSGKSWWGRFSLHYTTFFSPEDDGDPYHGIIPKHQQRSANIYRIVSREENFFNWD